jgi:hypothetical protein
MIALKKLVTRTVMTMEFAKTVFVCVELASQESTAISELPQRIATATDT